MKYKVIEKINIQYDGEILKLGDESDFEKLGEKEITKLVNQKYIVEVPIMGTIQNEIPKVPPEKNMEFEIPEHVEFQEEKLQEEHELIEELVEHEEKEIAKEPNDINEDESLVKQQEYKSTEELEAQEEVEPPKESDEGSFFNEESFVSLLTEEDLDEFKNKTELIEYGESIGCVGLSEKKSRDELTFMILSHIETLDYEEVEDEEEVE